ncbi:unnamed protein product, partial [Phaedon cochleariae]
RSILVEINRCPNSAAAGGVGLLSNEGNHQTIDDDLESHLNIEHLWNNVGRSILVESNSCLNSAAAGEVDLLSNERNHQTSDDVCHGMVSINDLESHLNIEHLSNDVERSILVEINSCTNSAAASEVCSMANEGHHQTSDDVWHGVVCNICDLLVDDLESHLNMEHLSNNVDVSHDSEEDKQGLCMYCGLNVEDIIHHLRIHGENQAPVVSEVEKQTKAKYSTKQHYCYFCNTLQTKLARHLERKHAQEVEVQKALVFPKGCIRRRSLLAEIQKKGDFIYSSSHEPISVRRCQTKSNNSEKIPCPFCKGFYSKKNLHNHVRLSCKSEEVKKQNVQTLSRAVLPKLHRKASDALRNKIFPPMRDDEVTKAIAYDELVIVYANLLASKYSSSDHHHKMIRNKLRHIGRILLAMKKIDSSIKDVMSIFDASHFDTFIKAVHIIAGLKDGRFQTPSFGPSSVTLFSQIGDVLQVEAIKKKDEQLEKDTQRFLKLLTTTSNSLINKVATENRTQIQRTQVVTLPKTEDVRKLFSCLDEKLKNNLEKLKNNFELHSWITLSKVTLVKVMIFNRKRPGDIEKSKIIEFNNLQMVDDEMMNRLDDNEKQYATSFGRYITRGKLDSPAPVLVSRLDIQAINMILKYRAQANIEERNPYLFASPIGSGGPYYKAGKVLSDFCVSERLSTNLTATKLRKHLATVTCTLQQSEQSFISDFMGHAMQIHNKIYRQRPVVQDVVRMGKFLNEAMGIEIGKQHPAVQGALQMKTFQNDKMEHMENVGVAEKITHVCENPSTECADEDSDYQHNLSTIMEESTDDDDSRIEGVIRRKNISRRPMSSTKQGLQSECLEQLSNEAMTVHTRENEENVSVAETCSYDYKNSSPGCSNDDSDYQPDLSTIMEVSVDEDESEIEGTFHRNNITRRKRPLRKQRIIRKRETWTTPERKAAREVFKHYLSPRNDAQPSLETCQEFIHGNKNLQNRAPNQIRAWVICEKRRMNRSSTIKHGWKTPEKELCRTHFKKYYLTESYPNKQELQEAIDKYKELQHTDVDKLRSHLQHDFKYLKRKKDLNL